MDSTLTPAGQAVYLSTLPTGSLVTPHDAQAIRAAAVAEMGWEGLRRAQLIAAFRNAALMPEAHLARHQWAHTAALFASPEGIL
ncbi:hypothetical protein JBE04_18030 [Streptomyces sp. PRKS01-29]|nr:hypothetical protein [Streptomyces sabulosicollis]MBI0296311.1 hypothetical protein [Streptomyces sabulosicollis]